MSVLRISQRWCFAAVLLSIVAYGASEENLGVLLLGVPGAFGAWLVTRGSPPRAMPRIVINILLFGIVAWGTLGLLRGGLGVTLFSQFVMALLIVKLLDRRGTRDTAQLLTLSVFLVIGAVLTSNSFMLGVLMLLFVPVIIAAVLWYQLSRVEDTGGCSPAQQTKLIRNKPLTRSVRSRTIGVIAGAIPIGACVFILMPRELGSKTLGAWGTASVGRTVGFNDEVRLGMGGLISQSQQPVLDMQLFDREGASVGSVGERYYLRGAILHDYDPVSGTWSRSKDARYSALQGPSPQLRAAFQTVGGGQPGDWTLRQEITIRSLDGNRGHLFSIWQTNQVRVAPPYQLQFSSADSALFAAGDSGKVSYTVHSTTRVPLPTDISDLTMDERLDPLIENPAIRRLADEILSAAGIEPDPLQRPAADDLDAISELRNYLTGGRYTYTLETLSAPPGRDPIEWFLNENREGHCEYYASALALLCRTVGIDARVITGYVATDYNETTRSYIVRASNAHAWVEAEALPGQWRRFDPTPTADLVRIHEPPSGMIADVRRFVNTLEFAWIRTVIGYDGEARRDLLGKPANSSSMFPLLERLSNSLRRTQRAPVNVLLTALRNALLAFCAAVFIGVLFVREKARLARLARWIRNRASGLFGAQPKWSPAERSREKLLGYLKRGGSPKPAWVPLRAHTAGLIRDGVLTGEPARAVTRIVDGLYAEYFAGIRAGPSDDYEQELGTVRAWARRPGGDRTNRRGGASPRNA